MDIPIKCIPSFARPRQMKKGLPFWTALVKCNQQAGSSTRAWVEQVAFPAQVHR